MSASLTLSADSSQFTAALDELAALAVKAPDGFVERLLSVSDRFGDFVCFDRDDLTATGAGELRFLLKPSEIMNGILATARAGEFDLSVFDALLHNPVSVVGVATTNEERPSGESQGSSDGCAPNPQAKDRATTPIPLSPFIAANNLFEESVAGPADRQTVAAASSPEDPSAAAVTHSPREVSSAVAPGMAHSNSDPLDIPDFLRRVRIKPEGEASVILNETRNIQETQS